MDRYNDLKILLKQWEHSFVKTHNRKPNKVKYIGKTFVVLINIRNLLFAHTVLEKTVMCHSLRSRFFEPAHEYKSFFSDACSRVHCSM